jgi:hypothetical protein
MIRLPAPSCLLYYNRPAWKPCEISKPPKVDDQVCTQNLWRGGRLLQRLLGDFFFGQGKGEPQSAYEMRQGFRSVYGSYGSS